MPIWVDDPWPSMNWIAAASAASIRVGGMSVEHMLPRDVDRQHDRRLVRRHAGDDHRSGESEAQTGEGEREQGERQVAAHERRAGQRLADEDQARVAHARRASPALAEHVEQDQHRQESEERSRTGHRKPISVASRPSEAGAIIHGSRPSQAREKRPPSARSSALAPAKSAVTSIIWGFTMSRVSRSS